VYVNYVRAAAGFTIECEREGVVSVRAVQLALC
jgi:hypothetical protein